MPAAERDDRLPRPLREAGFQREQGRDRGVNRKPHKTAALPRSGGGPLFDKLRRNELRGEKGYAMMIKQAVRVCR